MWKRDQVKASAPSETTDDHRMVERIVAGEREAALLLVDRHHTAMACVAASILGDATQVPDVVQEAWIRVLGGIPHFEFRSSLKTWILSVTANVARTMAKRLGRSERMIPVEAELEEGEPAVDPARFTAIGSWREPPMPWSHGEPESTLLRKELCALMQRELEALPPNQRAVVVLRDVEELTSKEICETLGVTEANQRILLHRGRARLRAAIEKERARK